MAAPDLLPDLTARGLVHDHTDRAALQARLAEAPVTLYCGFDPTADSLHVGHLLGLLMLRRFQLAGHRPLALVGGATGMIGDPGGRSEERNLLDEATLATNVAAIGAQVERLLATDGGLAPVAVLDNAAWTRELTLVAFLREVGKAVTVNQMVAKESVKARMAGTEGISYTEFSYMLLQANDYAWLHEREGCELQIGGSDQWGNITTGIDLIRRRAGSVVHGLTWPLLTKSDGTKFGKSQGGAVWLDPARTSPYRFYQFWVQTDDADVEARLLQLTLLGTREVAELMAPHREAPQQRVAQRRLAAEVTALVHGTAATRAAEAASAVLFGGSVEGVDEPTLAMVADEVPVVRLATLERPLPATDLLVTAGLAGSKGEARRLLEQGGAYLGSVPLGSEQQVDQRDLRFGRYLLLRRGKRSYAMVVVGGA